MGPLAGHRIIEVAGIGPAPFCAMLFSDMGAEIIRLDRRESADIGLPGMDDPKFDVTGRGRRSVAIDLKTPAGRDAALRIAATADGLIEGFRPGVMERLGLGPDDCAKVNERLVYGRMTGFGQTGPLAARAGHDINYIALSGVLASIGRKDEAPVPPLNLIGDYGGGGMLLAFGMVCALLETSRSGKGQVVDAAMTDGSAYLMSMLYGRLSQGLWSPVRGNNVLDGAAPWYDSYETSDGHFVAIGAIEGRFYKELIDKLGLAGEDLPRQHDRRGWPILRERFAACFASKSRDEWCAVFEGSDACFAPVLTMAEAPLNAHNVARGSFATRDGVITPAPVPRFSRTGPQMGAPASGAGGDTDAVLVEAGFSLDEIAVLRGQEIVGRKEA